MTQEKATIPVECQCGSQQLWQDTVAKAVSFCHHTDPSEAEELKLVISEMMNDFNHQISIEEFFNKPLVELAQEYSNMVIDDEMKTVATIEDHRATMISFLRYATLAIQYLRVHHVSTGTPPRQPDPQEEESPG